jgi:hypothetical protein
MIGRLQSQDVASREIQVSRSNDLAAPGVYHKRRSRRQVDGSSLGQKQRLFQVARQCEISLNVGDRRASTAAIELSEIEAGTRGFVINGVSASDYSGFSASGIGDVNGGAPITAHFRRRRPIGTTGDEAVMGLTRRLAIGSLLAPERPTDRGN